MQLDKFRKSVRSQWGEDGIIGEIFRRIGPENKLAVEFGAWDGEYLSNVWNLWHNRKWRAVLIESNEERHNEAKKRFCNFASVQFINALVRARGRLSLDNIY